MGKEGVRDADRVQLPYSYYLGGETITNANGQQLAIPHDASIIWISSEDDVTYWAIGVVASTASPGYIAAEALQVLGPMPKDQLRSQGVWVHGTNAIQHVTYWKDV